MKKIFYVMAALLLTACNPFGGQPGNPNPTGSPVGDKNAAQPTGQQGPAQIQEPGSPSAEQKGPATGELVSPGAPSETATANVASPSSCGTTVPVVNVPEYYGLEPEDYSSTGAWSTNEPYENSVPTTAGQSTPTIISGTAYDSDG